MASPLTHHRAHARRVAPPLPDPRPGGAKRPAYAARRCVVAAPSAAVAAPHAPQTHRSGQSLG
eukprot:6043870-Alexandrium_andersonii.AAC.1